MGVIRGNMQKRVKKKQHSPDKHEGVRCKQCEEAAKLYILTKWIQRYPR